MRVGMHSTDRGSVLRMPSHIVKKKKPKRTACVNEIRVIFACYAIALPLRSAIVLSFSGHSLAAKCHGHWTCVDFLVLT